MNLKDILNIIDMDFYLFKNLSKDVFVYRFRNIFGGLKERYPKFEKQIGERINYNLKIYYPEEKSLNEIAKERLNELADRFEKYTQESFESEADRIVGDAVDECGQINDKIVLTSTPYEYNGFYKEYLESKQKTYARSVKDRNEKISEDDLLNLEIALNSAKTFEEFLNLV